jgi:hypothetical protein
VEVLDGENQRAAARVAEDDQANDVERARASRQPWEGRGPTTGSFAWPPPSLAVRGWLNPRRVIRWRRVLWGILRARAARDTWAARPSP